MRSIAMFLSCLSPDDDVGPDAGEESGEDGEGGGDVRRVMRVWWEWWWCWIELPVVIRYPQQT
jgi:hypothetical protein